MNEMDAVRACALFATLSPVEKQDVLGMMLRLEPAAGTRVISQGDAPDGMYVVATGGVRVFHWDATGLEEHELARLAPGDLFGEMALLLDDHRHASVIAEEGTVLYRLDRAGFSELVESEDPVAMRIVLELARVICKRLNRLQGD